MKLLISEKTKLCGIINLIILKLTVKVYFTKLNPDPVWSELRCRNRIRSKPGPDPQHCFEVQYCTLVFLLVQSGVETGELLSRRTSISCVAQYYTDYVEVMGLAQNFRWSTRKYRYDAKL
jgi:hypothetical protein